MDAAQADRPAGVLATIEMMADPSVKRPKYASRAVIALQAVQICISRDISPSVPVACFWITSVRPPRSWAGVSTLLVAAALVSFGPRPSAAWSGVPQALPSTS